MSHFTVMVVTDPKDETRTLERVLQPFHEYECTGVMDEFVEWIDEHDNLEKEYAEKTRDMKQLANGEIVCPYDDRFKVEERSKDLVVADKYVYPAGTVDVAKPVSELQTLDEFATEWYGYEKSNKTGRYGRWTNPNYKWDWWEIGGRWAGKLISRSMGKRCNELVRRDLDLEAMRRNEREYSEKHYQGFVTLVQRHTGEDFAETLAKHPETKSWQTMLAEWKAAGEDFENHPRDAYWAQPLIALFKEAAHAERSRDSDSPYVWESDWFDSYGRGMEPYVQHWVDRVAQCHAFLDIDGKWHEKGQMLMFACVAGEKDQDAWNAEFMALLDAVDSDHMITVVDCHI